MSDVIYRLFGFWVRREACRLAALAYRTVDADDGYAPRIWSLAMFFEMYMLEGSSGTLADFGPKEPATIEAVEAA